MSAIDFPDSPYVDQTFTVGTRTWKWNGSVWETVRSVSSGNGAPGPTGATGPAGQGFNFRGVWQSGQAYYAYDVVNSPYSNDLYYLPSGSTNAGSFGSEWSLFLPAGIDGAQGPTGPMGPTGPAGSGGGNAFSVQQVGVSGVTQWYEGIGYLQFDEDAGFSVTNPSPGVAKVSMNSTFKYWQVNGVQKLTAEGLDTVNFVAGDGITIAADGTTSPQSITITSSAAAAAAGIHPFALIG